MSGIVEMTNCGSSLKFNCLEVWTRVICTYILALEGNFWPLAYPLTQTLIVM
jgi:hypothetical protein